MVKFSLFHSNGKFYAWFYANIDAFINQREFEPIGDAGTKGWNSKTGGRERYWDRGWSEGEGRGWGGQLNWEGMKGRVLSGRYHVTCLVSFSPTPRIRWKGIGRGWNVKIKRELSYEGREHTCRTVGDILDICQFLKTITNLLPTLILCIR